MVSELLAIPCTSCILNAASECSMVPTQDTSFIHSTANETDGDRYVLIIRFWHPEVTLMEKLAMQFVFDSIDTQDVRVAKKNLQKKYKALGIRKRI